MTDLTTQERERLARLREYVAACDVLLAGGCGTFLPGGAAIAAKLFGIAPDAYERSPHWPAAGDALEAALIAARDNTSACIAADFGGAA